MKPQDGYTEKRFPGKATIRQCKFCKHYEVTYATKGKGRIGFVEGNKARGRMIQHVKEQHADKL